MNQHPDFQEDKHGWLIFAGITIVTCVAIYFLWPVLS